MFCVSVSVGCAGGVVIALAAGSDGMDRRRGVHVEERQLRFVEPLLRLLRECLTRHSELQRSHVSEARLSLVKMGARVKAASASAPRP